MKISVGAFWWCVAACSIASAGDSSSDAPEGAAGYWGQWRGPSATGVAAHGDPPVHWAEDRNVRWKVEVPGDGLSTPIVWGDRVYIQTAIPTGRKAAGKDNKGDSDTESRPQPDASAPESGDRRGGERSEGRPGDARRQGRRGGRGGGRRGGPGSREVPAEMHRFVIMAFDRKTGRREWDHTVREAVPHEGSHRDGSLAPGSPVTDGEHLIANFGSRGLYCFDRQGRLAWEKDLGDMRTRRGFGEGGSPALYGNTLVVNWDHEADSFIVALDKRSGKELWRKARDEVTSWSTPLVVEQHGRPLAVVTATNRVRAYDLANGDVVWECGGLGTNCVPSPVVGFGMIYAMSGHRDKALLAIRYSDAKGDLTGSDAVVWSRDDGTPYVPSPLLHGDRLYYLDKNSALLSCFDAKTGTAHYTKQRLEKINGVYASPVGVGRRLYVAGRDGTTYVLRNAPEVEVLAVNELEDGFDASPAIVGDELYLRGRKHLYCIARD